MEDHAEEPADLTLPTAAQNQARTSVVEGMKKLQHLHIAIGVDENTLRVSCNMRVVYCCFPRIK